MRTILKGSLLLATMACVCTSLVAQNDAKSSSAGSKKPASEAAAMPMPKPDPQMTKMIKMMGGNWTVTEKSDPNPMMPKGGTGKGTATMTPGPGGMSLMEKYHSTGMMGGYPGAVNRYNSSLSPRTIPNISRAMRSCVAGSCSTAFA